jgi:hypothetical protein
MPGGAGYQRAVNDGRPPNGPFNQRLAIPGGPSRFDGPSDGPGSPRPPNSPMAPGTPSSPGGRVNPYHAPSEKPSVITNSRVELPAAAYQLDRTGSVRNIVLTSFVMSRSLSAQFEDLSIEDLKYRSRSQASDLKFLKLGMALSKELLRVLYSCRRRQVASCGACISRSQVRLLSCSLPT